MKHLHFVQSLEPLQGGGLGRAAFELSSVMGGLDGTSSLVVTTCRAEDHEPMHGVVSYPRRGYERAFFSPALCSGARRHVSEVDVVHAHGFYVATNWVLGRSARRMGKPLVCHPHGMFEPWILARSRFKKRVAHWLFEDKNFAHARLWRALTEKEAGQIRERGINSDIIVCPNGIELATFVDLPERRSAWGRQKSAKTLLFLARLHPKKGLDMLMRAWARLPMAMRQDWCIEIAGPDELGHRTEIEGLVQSLGLSREVRFCGVVGGEEKLNVLARADAFVLPSRSEGFSVAILEAMASCLPVLATTACNFPSLSQYGGGWSVEPSEDGIYHALLDLLREDEAGLKQRGAAARSLVEREFTWQHIAAKLDDACRSVSR